MTIYHIPEEPKAIIFDIDSTLYTNEHFAKSQIDVQIEQFAKLKNLDLNVAKEMVNSYRDEWSKLHDGKQRSLANTLIDFGITIEQSIQMRKDLITPDKYLFIDNKLVETLSELSKKFSLICVTNNPVSAARKILECLGVDMILPEIIGLDTFGISKPNVKMYELAAKRMNVKIEDCISVGDRFDIDIATPLEMGMGGILVDSVEDVYNLGKVI